MLGLNSLYIFQPRLHHESTDLVNNSPHPSDLLRSHLASAQGLGGSWGLCQGSPVEEMQTGEPQMGERKRGILIFYLNIFIFSRQVGSSEAKRKNGHAFRCAAIWAPPPVPDRSPKTLCVPFRFGVLGNSILGREPRSHCGFVQHLVVSWLFFVDRLGKGVYQPAANLGTRKVN